MKRFVVLILCIIFSINSAFAFGFAKKKDKKEPPAIQSGYSGTLPKIEDAFDAFRTTETNPTSIYNYDIDLDKETLQKIPVNNSKYVEIILKDNSPSDFILDLRDIIADFEKIKNNIDTKRNLQFFNAQVGSLINNINYFQEKYFQTDKYNNECYRNMLTVCNHAREIAIMNTKRQLQKQYLTSGEQIYSADYINDRLNMLSVQIGDIIVVLKDVKDKE